jgi:hypothetical protein
MNINKTTNIYNKLNLFEKTSILFLLFFTLNIPLLVSNIFGLGDLPDEEVFWLFPSLYLLYRGNIHKKYNNIPYIYLFVFVTIGFIVSELKIFRYNGFIPDYNYIIGFIKFYVIFMAIFTLEKKEQVTIYLLKSSVITCLIVVLYFYLSMAGLVPSVGVSEFTEDGRYVNSLGFQINGLSYIAMYGIFSITVAYSLLIYKKVNITLIIIGFFLLIIMLNSSRGVFLISIVLIVIFFRRVYKDMSFVTKFFLIIFFITLTMLFAYNFDTISNDIVVVRRVVNNEGRGRETQLLASWINFMNNPLFGVGNSMAGVSHTLNTLRSNVHYTQELASSGIFIASIYFILMYKMFSGKKLRYNTLSKMAFIIMTITLLSYNWSIILPIALVAYINVAYKNYNV